MTEVKKLRTLEGVYVPTLLTVLGVIMYLRLGFIVGNTGIIGALGIILIAHIITISTTLSMSSMLTNIKVGPGGAYSIISQSLGFEMGGAIGIPLYLSQAISVAFYITGFTELWATFFPTHPIRLVAFVTWLILAVVSFLSTKLAFRVQYFILILVLASIGSFIFGGTSSQANIQFVGSFGEAGFWESFTIFFPAVTGILTGATMSGELENPRKSIIKGTLGAVITGFVIYCFIAIMFSLKASPEQLIANNLIILELSLSKIAVIAGIMGAVLSSALSTLVSAPRTLSALAENRSVPFYKSLNKKGTNGEPRQAIVFSSLLSLIVLLLGNLDGLANLLTLFFLTTYAMINLVVLLEQSIGLVSFRPSLTVSIFVPIIGLFGAVFSMFLINRQFVFITFFIVALIYFLLQRRQVVSPWGDIRGGIFRSIAEWAAQKSMDMPYHPKLWKPSVIIPVETPNDFKRISYFLRSFIYPSGRAYYLTINDHISAKDLAMIKDVLMPLKSEKLFAHEVVITSDNFEQELPVVLQSLSSDFLPPNSIFFTISNDKEKQQKLKNVLSNIKHTRMGVMCLYLHPKYNFGQSKQIYIWLREKSPNYNLAVLSAHQISKNWGAKVTLCRIVNDSEKKEVVEDELKHFIEAARLPLNTHILVKQGRFKDIIQGVNADLHILGVGKVNDEIRFDDMIHTMNMLSTSVLFVSDSGLENALV